MGQTQLVQRVEAWVSSPPALTPALGREGAPELLPLGSASPSSASYQHQGPWRRDSAPRAEPPYRGPSVMAFTSCL